MNERQYVIQQLQEFITYHQVGVEGLKEIASAKGFIYAIVDQQGRIQATRRSLGAAHRILQKGKLNSLSGALIHKEERTKEYRVITVHLSDFS